MKSFKDTFARVSVKHYKIVTWVMVLFTIACGVFIPRIKVDTDPENMLSADEPVRVFHNATKKEFDLSDIVVLGIINEDNKYGVFNPATLQRIYELTQYAETLRWPEKGNPDKTEGVIEADMIAPSLVDHIGQGGPGVIKFEWLMPQPPKTEQEALAVRDKALSNPLLTGTMVSADGRAICLYLPLTNKDLSYRVYSAMNERIPIIKEWLDAEKSIINPNVTPQQQDAFHSLGRFLAFKAKDISDFEQNYYKLATMLTPKAREEINVDGIVNDLKTFAQANSVTWKPMLQSQLQTDAGQALDSVDPDKLKADFTAGGPIGSLQKSIQDIHDKFYITGLPVAEDTFGVEMFIQMAISAPLAMLTIFILMLIFFRKLVLVISPMIIAMVSVISTMGLLIGFGFPVHIMSSMIPIFLMPIAVVDSVHILSEFFDVYTKEKGRRESINEVMHTLFTPMLYTSLTSAAGFLSLALTPIPPVQVFGVFVAIGIMIAWIFTVTFVPAYVMMIPEKRLANFGMAVHHEDKPGALTRILHRVGEMTYRYAKPILAVLVVVTGLSIWGITKIQINDNPVKWFSKSHPIRQADIALNKHFGGTYMAFLVLGAEPESQKQTKSSVLDDLKAKLDSMQKDYPKASVVKQQLLALNTDNLATLKDAAEKAMNNVPADDDDLFYAWNEIVYYLDNYKAQQANTEPFKQPAVLRYMAGLQQYLENSGLVGKSNSLADIVKKVHQELIDGSKAEFRIPDNKKMVSETLIQYQQSHRPQDLWHFTTPDYKHVNIWMQLTSGDNKDMERVVKAVNQYFNEHKPPIPMTHQWAGLTYINTVWQNKMVFGMLQSFLGSFLVVFIMMSVLFRSPLWGLLCMVPLTITIVVIYGTIGFIGKDYDMPVAVLSALTLGMAVDFAIHFLQRSRTVHAETGSWKTAAGEMFGEPARAITRNVLVIAIGFLPLLAAPLVPYKTVGIFLCAIMGVSGVITLLALPAVLSVAEKWFFKKSEKVESVGCNCGFCIIVGIAAVGVILLNLHQYWHLRVTTLAWIGAGAIPVLLAICGLVSRRKTCKTIVDTNKSNSESGA